MKICIWHRNIILSINNYSSNLRILAHFELFWHESIFLDFDIKIWIWHGNINFRGKSFWLNPNLTTKFDIKILFSWIWHEKYSTTWNQTLYLTPLWSPKDLSPIMSEAYMEDTMVPPPYHMETLRHSSWYTKDLTMFGLGGTPPNPDRYSVFLTSVVMPPDLGHISGQISGWGLRSVVRSVVDHWSRLRSVALTPDLRVRSVVVTPRSVLCGIELLIWPLIWLRSGAMTTDLSLDQWSTTDLTTGLKADQVSWPLIWSANHWSDHWSENKT